MRLGAISGLVCLALLFSTDRAVGRTVVRIQFFDGTSTQVGPDHDYDPATTNISISAPSTAVRMDAFVYPYIDASTTDMGRISVSGGPAAGQAFDIVLGTGGRITGTGGIGLVARNWRGLSTSTTTSVTVLSGGIFGDLVSGSGGVSVGNIARFDVGGAVNASIQTTNTSAVAQAIMNHGSINATITVQGGFGGAQITTTSGDIAGLIQVVNGNLIELQSAANLRSNIQVSAGLIQAIDVPFGDIQSATDPTNRVQILARDGVTDHISANGSVYANITANSGGSGNFKRLSATSGSFVGSLTANSLTGSPATDGIRLNQASGDLLASVTLAAQIQSAIRARAATATTISVGTNVASGAVVNFAAASNVTISIRRSLLGSLTFPGLGLLGQVVINADAPVVSPGVWTGQVMVDGTTLNPPAYAQTDASLGGGAIGLVPFRHHVEDSSPGSPQFAGGQVRLRFYGPISNSTPLSMPVVVQFRTDPSYGWSDVSSNFTPTISGRDLTLTAIHDLVSPDEDVVTFFRITPQSNLICSPSVITGGASVSVNPFDWQFTP